MEKAGSTFMAKVVVYLASPGSEFVFYRVISSIKSCCQSDHPLNSCLQEKHTLTGM